MFLSTKSKEEIKHTERLGYILGKATKDNKIKIVDDSTEEVLFELGYKHMLSIPPRLLDKYMVSYKVVDSVLVYRVSDKKNKI